MSLIRLINRHLALKQFIKFATVGFLSTVLDFGLYIILTRLIAVQYLWANFIALIIGATFNFIFNKNWTFRSYGQKIYWQYIKFWVVALLGLAASQYLLYLFVAKINIYDILAKAMAALMVMFCRFIMHKYWVFKL